MIEMRQVSKSFGGYQAVDQVSVQMKEGSIFGLVGTNGAGKSTILRMLSGVLKPDSGEILVDGRPIYENPQVKQEIFYISDDQHFLNNSAPQDMKRFFSRIYPNFDKERFDALVKKFELHGRIKNYSKGMKKQLAIICGLCSGTRYLLCDETFDGLDPVMRQAVKGIFAGEVSKRAFTPIIASHNLRELEDICDHVGLIHKGGVLFSKDLEEMKYNIHGLQCIFRHEEDVKTAFHGLEVLKLEQRGSLYTVTVRGNRHRIEEQVQSVDPLFWEVLALSLEEIFISETEVVGYDISKLVL